MNRFWPWNTNYLFQFLAFIGLTMSALAHAKKSFIYCSEGSPSIFNPQLATDGTTFNNTRTIYNRLVEFEPGVTTLKPGLAKSWEISPDGKTYTFRLRQKVNFHKTEFFQPTRPFNARDVLFSFNRQRLATHPYHKVSGGSYEYFNSMGMKNLIADIRQLDLYTVQFILTRAEAPFLANLAMDFASILSAEYGKKLLHAKTPDLMDHSPVGTGPFVFVRYQKDQLVRYKANSSYFLGKPAIDQLIFAINRDPSIRYQKLKTGECHLATEPAPQDLQAMRDNKKIAVLEQEGLNIGYLGMNVEKPPLDDVRVRRAIHHALNRKAYIQAIYLGHASVAKNPIPPGLWSYDQTTQDYAYDPILAKKLLKQAGYDNKKNLLLELWTLPVSRPYNPNGKKMGEMMQADLAKIGIKIQLISYDWPTYLAKSKNGEHQLLQLGWTGDNGDPDNFLGLLLGCKGVDAGSNRSRWCHQPFDKLTEAAKINTNKQERTKLYQQAQKIFKTQAPWVTLAHSKVYRAMSTKVVGYKIDPFGRDSFDQVDLKP